MFKLYWRLTMDLNTKFRGECLQFQEPNYQRERVDFFLKYQELTFNFTVFSFKLFTMKQHFQASRFKLWNRHYFLHYSTTNTSSCNTANMRLSPLNQWILCHLSQAGDRTCFMTKFHPQISHMYLLTKLCKVLDSDALERSQLPLCIFTACLSVSMCGFPLCLVEMLGCLLLP